MKLPELHVESLKGANGRFYVNTDNGTTIAQVFTTEPKPFAEGDTIGAGRVEDGVIALEIIVRCNQHDELVEALAMAAAALSLAEVTLGGTSECKHGALVPYLLTLARKR